MIDGRKYQPVLYSKDLKDYKKFQKGTLQYNAFWKEQTRRIIEGYKPTGGTWIPGNYYFYLNFSKIHGLAPGARRKGMISPIYRDQDHEYYLEVHNAKEGGYGIIVLKARRKGFSYMNANILLHEWICFAHSENGIGAQKELYVQDFKKKMMLSYNELPPQLRPKILRDNEELLMSGYKVKEDGVWVEKGMKSMVHFRVMDNPGAFRGTSLNYMVFEEAGEFLKLKKGYQANEECFRDGAIQFGTPIIGGTSNQMEIESDDYMEMFMDADKYNLKAVFISAAKVYPGFFDMSKGISDIKGATADIEKRAELKRQTGDISDLYAFRQEMPLEIEHAFLRTGGSPFRLDLLNKQIANINTNKRFDIVRRGRLDWPKDENGKEIFGGKPVWVEDFGELDLKNPEKELFPFEIVEMPLDDYKNCDVAAVDPYHIDDDLEEIKKNGKVGKDRSKGCMAVYRRFVNTNVPCEMPVAFYTDRPESKAEFYENCLKLAIFYDCQVLVEYNDSPFLNYFIDNKFGRFLKERPRSADSPYSVVSNKYGVHMKAHQKKIVTELLDEYIKNHWEDIYFLKLLVELCVYGTKNTDRAMAFGMALLHDMDNLRKVKPKEEEKEEKMHIPHFKRDASGMIISVHQKSGLDSSSRNATFDYNFDDD